MYRLALYIKFTTAIREIKNVQHDTFTDFKSLDLYFDFQHNIFLKILVLHDNIVDNRKV